MDKQSAAFVTVGILIVAGLTGVVWVSTNDGGNEDTDTLYQVSLLQALMLGDYDGSVSISELKKHGSVGIGTFDHLNGELIMLDGVVYRAAVGANDECVVSVVQNSETVPFANVAFMEGDLKATVSSTSLATMQDALSAQITGAPNSFYFATIHATFTDLTVRSELAQSEPYKPLVDVLATDQREWTKSEVSGTVVALYCPSYMDKVNTYGWHLHFISDDRSFGGHVLNLTVTDAEVQFNKITDILMVTPDTERFQSFDLSVDQSEDINDVEG